MDKTVDYDSIGAMMEFTEILKKDPRKALDFMESNADRFTKEALTDILKEVLESVKYIVKCHMSSICLLNQQID